MIIDLHKEVQNDSLLSWVVIEGLTASIKKELYAKKLFHELGKKDNVDIQITVDGYEIDLLDTINFWQSQVEEMIKDKAEDIILSKFNDLDSLLHDLTERIEPEIKARLESWELD